MIAFSIIIPLYNKARTIRTTIESVLNQRYPHFELLVVDDGSTDESASIVRLFNDERIRLFEKGNGGPSSARNYGVLKATNPWILFLDADDLLLEDALETFYNTILAYPEFGIYTANFYCSVKNQKYLFSEHYTTGGVKSPFKSWFFHQLMPRAGACILKKSIMQAYPYKDYLYRSEDVEMMFNAIRSNRVFRINTPVMVYCLDQAAESQNRTSILRDFQGHLEFDRKKSLWERICLYELYVEAKNNYPDEVDTIYPDMTHQWGLRVAYYFAFWYRAFRKRFGE